MTIVGGYGAVSGGVETQLKAFGRGLVTRLYGQNRYDTAAKLSPYMPAFSETVFLATGASFPYALGGSAAAGRLKGSLPGPGGRESQFLSAIPEPH